MNKKYTIFLLLFLLLFSGCNKKVESNIGTTVLSQIENVEPTNDKNIEVYYGPGEEYCHLGFVNKSNIKKVIKLEKDWAEISYEEKRGYVKQEFVNDLIDSTTARIVYKVNQDVTLYSKILCLNLEYRLFDEATTYYLPHINQSVSRIEAGSLVKILAMEEEKFHVFYQIEYTDNNGLKRAYAEANDLFALNNPLLNFDSVKNCNAIVQYNGLEYYSTDGKKPISYSNWKTVESKDIVDVNIDVMAGIVNVISSNDINDEAIESTEHKMSLYSINDKQYMNVNSKGNKMSNMFSLADFIFGTTIAFCEGANDTFNLSVELQEYENEHRIVIKAGSPFERVYEGKKLSLEEVIVNNSNTPATMIDSNEIANKVIHGICPELPKNEKYSMDLTFSKDFSDGYGYNIVIDKQLKIYAVPILHPGTSFEIYCDGKFIFDVAPSLKKCMLELDEKSSQRILTILLKNGFVIDGFGEIIEWDKLYFPIISQYKKYVDNYSDYPEIDENISKELQQASFSSSYNLYYSLYDIDKNGVPELIIGGGEDTNVLTNWDLYSYHNNVPIKVFDNYEFGYKTNYHLLGDGVVGVEWSGGVPMRGYDYYKIAGDGYKNEKIDGISIERNWNDETEIIKYYNNNKEEITENEYYIIYNKYKSIEKDELVWELVGSLNNKHINEGFSAICKNEGEFSNTIPTLTIRYNDNSIIQKIYENGSYGVVSQADINNDNYDEVILSLNHEGSTFASTEVYVYNVRNREFEILLSLNYDNISQYIPELSSIYAAYIKNNVLYIEGEEGEYPLYISSEKNSSN